MAKIKFKGIDLTQEQVNAVLLGRTKEDLKIEAYAGSGKTFLLRVLAELFRQQGRSCIYLAFNKPVALEAESLFQSNPNVECSTAHSLAYKAVGWKYKDKLLMGKLNGSALIRLVDVGPELLLPKVAKANMIIDTIEKFCQSADKQIQPDHVPFMDMKNENGSEPAKIQEERKEIVRVAKRIWEEMSDPKGIVPITHNGYLKIWGLSQPRIRKDVIFFDEAQDANGAMLDIVSRQTHCQRIFVGDRYQQLYAWNGAVNAMQKIQTANTCQISQSFRFGNAIARKANEILNSYLEPEVPIKIKGNPDKNSRLAHILTPDAVLCRTNGMVIAKTFEFLGNSKVYIQGGTQSLTGLLKAVEDLKSGKRTSHSELSLFESWEELKDYSDTKSGQGVKSLVNIVERFGTRKLINVLYKTCDSPAKAQTIISTVHKAKGLEWERVILADDFKYPKDKDSVIPAEEVNVLYVAITRALHQLDVSDCRAANPIGYS